MGTLSSELGPHVERLVERPRIYADANLPNGVVSFMRVTLGWDVLFVLEQEDLRRAPDIDHYRLARQLGRTLITLDRDYTDDRRFPPVESPGVIVFSAPDERWLRRLLKDADESLFRSANATRETARRPQARVADRQRAAVIVLANAHVVLPDRILSPGAVLLEGDRILDVVAEAPAASPGDLRLDLQHQTIVPGFIDVHVHGVEGSDSLDGAGAIARIAAALPRYGVTGFCPTSVACDPEALRTMLTDVRSARLARPSASSRVLPAHLESNFINPDYRGAQPLALFALARRRGSRRGVQR